MMNKSTSPIFYLAILIGMFPMALPTTGMGESGWKQFQNHGLALSYPSEWKRMRSKSTAKIQGMLNQQFRQMGNTQVGVIGLDVLLDLPAFRVMITKERFETAPSSDYLIKERTQFFTEAKRRGGVQSFGEMKPLTINGHSAVEFDDVDKGPQGYGSSIRLLCGKNTWHISFTGNTQESYHQYQPIIKQLTHSMALVEPCDVDS